MTLTMFLSYLFQVKCHRYWPDTENQPLVFAGRLVMLCVLYIVTLDSKLKLVILAFAECIPTFLWRSGCAIQICK